MNRKQFIQGLGVGIVIAVWSEIKEGEALIFKIDPSNKSTLVGHLQSSGWIAAAASE
jgi:hypothetical protein